MTSEPTELSAGIDDTWCGHLGEYQITAHMCMGRAQAETVVRCLTEGCGREYLGSMVAAWAAARKAPSDAARCKHEMLVADCGECSPRKPRARRPAVPASVPRGLFEARYPGRCAQCDSGRIEPGDMIRRSPDGDGYLCAECAEGE